MSVMNRGHFSSQRGAINTLLVPLITVTILFLGVSGFAIWAFGQRQDYKNNSDQKVAAAVDQAKHDEDIVKDNQNAEANKSPLKTYNGPDQYGSVKVSYPKTWSAYVIEASSGGSNAVDGYFQPNFVPNTSDQNSLYALRVKIVNQSYTSVVSDYKSLVDNKQVAAAPFSFARVPSIVGIRYEGNVQAGKKISGSMVVVPLRDKTLEVWTESTQYINDFNTYVLPNLTFSP